MGCMCCFFNNYDVICSINGDSGSKLNGIPRRLTWDQVKVDAKGAYEIPDDINGKLAKTTITIYAGEVAHIAFETYCDTKGNTIKHREMPLTSLDVSFLANEREDTERRLKEYEDRNNAS